MKLINNTNLDKLQRVISRSHAFKILDKMDIDEINTLFDINEASISDNYCKYVYNKYIGELK